MQGPPLYSVGPGTCRIVMPNNRCKPNPLRFSVCCWDRSAQQHAQRRRPLHRNLRARAPAVRVVARAAQPPGPDAILEHAQRDAPVHDEDREQERRQVQQPQQQRRLPRHLRRPRERLCGARRLRCRGGAGPLLTGAPNEISSWSTIAEGGRGGITATVTFVLMHTASRDDSNGQNACAVLPSWRQRYCMPNAVATGSVYSA